MKLIPIKTIPELDWSELAQKHLARTGEAKKLIIARSSHMWLIEKGDEPLLVAGILRRSLMSRPEAWALFTKQVRPIHARGLRKVFDKYRPLIVMVEKGEPTAVRLAKFFGLSQGVDRGHLTMYEARNGI